MTTPSSEQSQQSQQSHAGLSAGNGVLITGAYFALPLIQTCGTDYMTTAGATLALPPLAIVLLAGLSSILAGIMLWSRSPRALRAVLAQTGICSTAAALLLTTGASVMLDNFDDLLVGYWLLLPSTAAGAAHGQAVVRRLDTEGGPARIRSVLVPGLLLGVFVGVVILLIGT